MDQNLEMLNVQCLEESAKTYNKMKNNQEMKVGVIRFQESFLSLGQYCSLNCSKRHPQAVGHHSTKE